LRVVSLRQTHFFPFHGVPHHGLLSDRLPDEEDRFRIGRSPRTDRNSSGILSGSDSVVNASPAQVDVAKDAEKPDPSADFGVRCGSRYAYEDPTLVGGDLQGDAARPLPREQETLIASRARDRR
jgi:hypothetical protein